MQLRGFGDVQFRATDGPASTATFSMGQMDVFITSRLAEDVTVLSEVVFEGNDRNETSADVERLLVQIAPSDRFEASLGRYHTAIGYYNTAYHHGAWFETAIGRPRLFAFEDEGGLLPLHGIGASFRGRVPSAALGLRWIAEIGNGRGNPDASPVQIARDSNRAKSVNVGLIARPSGAPGLQAGFSFYQDRVGLGPDRNAEGISAWHVVYKGNAVEWLSEVVRITHRRMDADGSSLTSKAGYVQVSRGGGRLRPYLRLEMTDVASGDPIGAQWGRTTGPTVGARYDLRDLAVVKAQWERLSRTGGQATQSLTVQLAFAF